MGAEEVEDLGFGQVEAEGFEGDFQLVVVNVAVLVEVEERELCVATTKKVMLTLKEGFMYFAAMHSSGCRGVFCGGGFFFGV